MASGESLFHLNIRRPANTSPRLFRHKSHSRFLILLVGIAIGFAASAANTHRHLQTHPLTNVHDPSHRNIHHAGEALPPPDDSQHRDCILPHSCGTTYYGKEDPITAAAARLPEQLRAFYMNDLELHFTPKGVLQKVTVTENCYKKVDTVRAPLQQINSTLINRIEAAPKDDMCAEVDGNFFIVSDIQGRATENIFDELSTLWYHIWLLNRHMCKRYEPPRWKIMYMNDILNGMPVDWHQAYEKMFKASVSGPPFPNILPMFGDYYAWPELAKQAVQAGGCVRLKRAVTTPSSWLWLDKAIPSYSNAPLQEFVNAILGAYDLGGPRTSRCNYKLLYATRKGMKARRVLNEPNVLKAIKEAVPEFEVHSFNLGELSFKDQLKEVTSADVFVFPHGGAGPHVMFLPPGAVIIELFPYADADPMYRNLGVQTGKSYLTWQAAQHANPHQTLYIPGNIYSITDARHIYHFSNESNFVVDLKAIKSLVTSAAHIVKNSVGTNWFPSTGNGIYSAFLCTICTGEGRVHTCTQG